MTSKLRIVYPVAVAAVIALVAAGPSAFADKGLSGTTTTTVANASKYPARVTPTTLPATTQPSTTTTVAPPTSASATRSVRSGSWSDPATWDRGVPSAGAAAFVESGHTVTFDRNPGAVAGLTVAPGGTLAFAANASATLESTRNVIVHGTLQMRPASSAVTQTLRFVGIDESRYVGGGMDPLDSDVGLWVMGAGRLDIVGSAKTAWARAAGSVGAGATSVTLASAPAGWNVGDELSIAPTEAPTVGGASSEGFDEQSVAGIAGATVALRGPTARAHPMVDGRWTAEVMNLTRNVRIEGTASGRAHIFIRSTTPQTLHHLALRHLGPRKDRDGDGFTDDVLGRYGLHFHMAADGSRGSQVVGVVVRDTDAHAFVPHASHGVTFRETIAYNTADDAYWWDANAATNTSDNPHQSHDITIDRSVAARVRSMPAHRGYRLAGFVIGDGEGNVIRDSVAVGVQGNRESSGFFWPEIGPGLWDFTSGNIAHNNRVNGIFVWENAGPFHDITNFAAYYNGEYGINHGAYFNRYRYADAHLYGNGIAAVDLRATSGTAETQASVPPADQIRFDNVVFDGGGVSSVLVRLHDHAANGVNRPAVFRNSTFRGAPTAFRLESPVPYAVDALFCSLLTPNDVQFGPDASADSVVRVQNSSTEATRITRAGRTSIAPFASADGAYRTSEPPAPAPSAPSK